MRLVILTESIITKNGLEYYQKNMNTDKHEHWNLTERLHRRTLTVEHDQKYI